MSFDHALYYPWIDIQNSEWLKTAILYWDKISTIVPEGMGDPYQNGETYTLQCEHILEPYNVSSNSMVVTSAGNIFRNFLKTKEAKSILNTRFTPEQEGRLNNNMTRVYLSKLSPEIKRKLLEFPSVHDSGDYFEIDNQTANYYMDLLAAEISQEQRWGLLTDTSVNESLTSKVRRNDSAVLQRSFHENQAPAMLVKLAFQGVKIEPNTPLETILDFRSRHTEELINFRNEIDDLQRTLDPEIKTVDDLNQIVNNIYERRISPAILRLRRSLLDSNINLLIGSLLPVLTVCSNIALKSENPLLTCVLPSGLQIALSTVIYHRSKKRKLEENPWSYILSLRELM